MHKINKKISSSPKNILQSLTPTARLQVEKAFGLVGVEGLHITSISNKDGYAKDIEYTQLRKIFLKTKPAIQPSDHSQHYSQDFSVLSPVNSPYKQVLNLQKFYNKCIKLKIINGKKIIEDGKYGSETSYAVAKLQKWAKDYVEIKDNTELPITVDGQKITWEKVDGLYGIATYLLLYRALEILTQRWGPEKLRFR